MKTSIKTAQNGANELLKVLNRVQMNYREAGILQENTHFGTKKTKSGTKTTQKNQVVKTKKSDRYDPVKAKRLRASKKIVKTSKRSRTYGTMMDGAGKSTIIKKESMSPYNPALLRKYREDRNDSL
ncbi:hypothetical protein [Sediminibacter sp. Hel_I_10]|uniref:hypothetical protein n=1 Tax=Sediminibacter sp. Hel_I_10 TaxID=1392490 RepID=UPI00047AC25B|nr:hypothetical protein [Sediminibacter sp. Hel_I_10]